MFLCHLHVEKKEDGTPTHALAAEVERLWQACERTGDGTEEAGVGGRERRVSWPREERRDSGVNSSQSWPRERRDSGSGARGAEGVRAVEGGEEHRDSGSSSFAPAWLRRTEFSDRTLSFSRRSSGGGETKRDLIEKEAEGQPASAPAHRSGV